MKPFLIPQPVNILVSLLPRYPHSLIFTRVINLALKDQLRDEVWQPLHGKRVCIRVRDAGIAFHFTLGASGLIARHAAAQPDLAISASAQDFFLLALRKEDPDTLFFSRRLVMEGAAGKEYAGRHGTAAAGFARPAAGAPAGKAAPAPAGVNRVFFACQYAQSPHLGETFNPNSPLERRSGFIPTCRVETRPTTRQGFALEGFSERQAVRTTHARHNRAWQGT